MARRVYYAFDYQDVKDFRVNVVRNRHKLRKGEDLSRDGSIWETYPIKKVKSIKSLIDRELKGNSVTCVLIGTNTFSRRWVRYELVKSFTQNKGLFGVGINWIKDKNKEVKILPGRNPYNYLKLKVSTDGKSIDFYEKREEELFAKWVIYKDFPKAKNTRLAKDHFGKEYTFSDFFTTYSYSFDNGTKNFDRWVQEAAEN